MCQKKIVFLLIVACATTSVNCAKKEGNAEKLRHETYSH